MEKYRKIVISIVTLSIFSGCGAVDAYNGDIGYVNTQNIEQTTLNFGSTDLNMIAEKMVISLLQALAFDEKNKPVIVLSHVKNKTNEQIDTKSITDKIKISLIKSGLVRVSLYNEIGDELKSELSYQASEYVKKGTAKQIGNQIGADYKLYGEITSIEKSDGEKIDIYYKITLNLVNIESGIAVWADEKEIRKIGAKSLFTPTNVVKTEIIENEDNSANIIPIKHALPLVNVKKEIIKQDTPKVFIKEKVLPKEIVTNELPNVSFKEKVVLKENMEQIIAEQEDKFYIDKESNLMWSSNSVKKQWLTDENFKTQNYANTNGDTANNYCSNLVSNGYDNWRLPTIDELRVVVNSCGGVLNKKRSNEKNARYQTCYKNRGFNSAHYWSATNNIDNANYAWLINLYGGYDCYDDKDNTDYVRCVRPIE